MAGGYEAFGKNYVDSQSGRASLDAMRNISRIMGNLITVDEEAEQYIREEYKNVFTKWNDVIDMELREVLDSTFCAITAARNNMISAQVQLNNCIQRRIEYLCSLDEIMEENEVEKNCESTE